MLLLWAFLRPVCLWMMIHSGESPEKMTSPATSGNWRESVCVMQHILNVSVCYFANATAILYYRKNVFMILHFFSLKILKLFKTEIV